MAKLILRYKGIWMNEYPLSKPIIKIGKKNGNDIKINDIMVSRSHAIVLKVNGSYIIVDSKSTNGTFVNYEKVVQTKLYHNDEITIGNHTLIFEDETQIRMEEKRPLLDAKPQDSPVVSEEELIHNAQSKVGTDITEEIENIASLNFLAEPTEYPEIMLREKITIIGAREDADIKLKGAFVPKVAVLINKKSSGYSIIRTQERLKVKVNGNQIVRETELADGDVIEMGTLKFDFSMP